MVESGWGELTLGEVVATEGISEEAEWGDFVQGKPA